MATHTVIRTAIESVPLLKRGKVRDVYNLGEALRLLTHDTP